MTSNIKIHRYYTIVLILLLSIVIGSLYTSYRNKFEYFNSNNNIDLVIARYNENLEWLDRSDIQNCMRKLNKIHIYNKGNNIAFISQNNYIPSCSKEQQIKIHDLPNIGRESHTYLQHIVNNYDNLPKVTKFVVGSSEMEHKWGKVQRTIEKTCETENSVFICEKYNPDNTTLFNEMKDFTLDTYASTNKANFTINNESRIELSEDRPYGNWYTKYFKDIPYNAVSYNSIFAVSKEHILNRPKQFYVDLVNLHYNSSNPEIGHYLERSWASVFYPVPKECLYNLHDPNLPHY